MGVPMNTSPGARTKASSRSKSKERSRIFPGWIWPCIIVLTIVSVWVRLGVVASSYDVSQAEKTIRSLRLDREQIELRVAGLKSPRRLEGLARSQFGLSQARPEQVVHMEEHSR